MLASSVSDLFELSQLFVFTSLIPWSDVVQWSKQMLFFQSNIDFFIPLSIHQITKSKENSRVFTKTKKKAEFAAAHPVQITESLFRPLIRARRERSTKTWGISLYSYCSSPVITLHCLMSLCNLKNRNSEMLSEVGKCLQSGLNSPCYPLYPL